VRLPGLHGQTRRSGARQLSDKPAEAPGDPMPLGNMRANGARLLDVSCWRWHHRAILSADSWPDDVPVPSFGAWCARDAASSAPTRGRTGKSSRRARR
jgi:hypothetical protein